MKKILLAIAVLFFAGAAHAQLSGTYSIGATLIGSENANFPTLSAAAAALNASGVNGPCIFYFTDNATYTDTAIALGIPGTSAVNTVTFKPYTGVTCTISLTSLFGKTIDGMWVIGSNNPAGTVNLTTLIPTSYVTIDGSNTPGGTTKDLTIQGPVNNAQRSIFRIYGDNDNLTFKNLIIINNFSASSTNAAINVSNYYSSTSFVPNNTNYNPDNLTIQNCTITSTAGTASTGIHISYSGSTTPTNGMNNLVIRDNIIAGNLRGIFTSYTNNADIFGNTITVASTGATTNLTSYGITVQTNFASTGVFNIYNNKLTSLTTNCTLSGASNGIMGIDNENTSSHVVNIYNNFIGGFGLTGTPNNAKIYGIRVTSTSTSNIYNNTINIPELPDMATSNNIAGIAMATAATTEASPSAAAIVTIKDNIIRIDESTMKVWGIRRVGSTGTFTSDYNDVYINPANTSGYYGYFNAADCQTIGAWQTASSQDANSKNVNVTFASASDLHLSGGSNGDLNLIGTPLGTVTTDIDGTTRNATYPYMGADEGTVVLPVELVSFTAAQHGASIILSWKTASEVNNHGFEVERRTMADGTWEKIGFVEGAGTSNAPKNYQFVDAKVQGMVSYRLKQVDRDGGFTYSNIVEAAALLAPQQYELTQNYPNPFNPSTMIRFAVKESEHASLKVYDVTGREVAELFNGQAEAGKYYQVSFNAGSFASGMYIYVLATPSHREVKKMQLLK